MTTTISYFREWLEKQSILYGKKISVDGVGKTTYEDDVELDCYIHGNLTKVINDKGEEVVSSEQIYLDGEDAVVAVINFGDRFKIGENYRPIKSIAKFYNEEGVLDLVVIYL